jgi:hypothetical protein
MCGADGQRTLKGRRRLRTGSINPLSGQGAQPPTPMVLDGHDKSSARASSQERTAAASASEADDTHPTTDLRIGT